MLWTGHAQIGNISRSLGQDPQIRRGHMGVGAPHRADAPIQIVGQSQLLAGGLGVEIHQRKGGLLLFLPQQLVRRQEGVVGVVVQIAPADEIHHGDADGSAVIDAVAPAGSPGGIVGGAQDIGAVLQIVRDLHLAPRMVAQRDDVGAGIEEILGGLGAEAAAVVVGILAVVMIIIGGIQYTTSGGDQAAVTKAKNTILYGIVGLVIAILAYAIVNFVIRKVGS